MQFSVSIVIRTYGVEKIAELLKCINAQDSVHAVLREIILVNGRNDCNLIDYIDLTDMKLTIIELKIPQEKFSYGKALNTGIQKTTGEIIAFLSGHSIPLHRNWLNSIIAPFLDSSVGGVCGSQVPMKESNIIERVYRLIWYNTPILCRAFGSFNATNAAIKKSLWETYKFNEDIDSCEDRLWAKNIKRLGRTIVFVHEASVCHSHLNTPAESLKYFLKLWTSMFKIWLRT